VEPGRYLVGEAGVYIARVNDIKVSRGKKFLILDGGMHHHLAASGNLGQTIKRNYPIALVEKLAEPEEEIVDVVGPLCTPLDMLGRGVNLPRAEVGDLIGVFQSGAYARSASPLGFLSHPAPPEVWIARGQHRLIRRRGETGGHSLDEVVEKEVTAASR
jgi:diaminopimelate decarboxylase